MLPNPLLSTATDGALAFVCGFASWCLLTWNCRSLFASATCYYSNRNHRIPCRAAIDCNSSSSQASWRQSMLGLGWLRCLLLFSWTNPYRHVKCCCSTQRSHSFWICWFRRLLNCLIFSKGAWSSAFPTTCSARRGPAQGLGASARCKCLCSH